MIYWKESGYFDVSSHDKILLHTWSLSVEWQFYLLYPIAILYLYKIKPSIKVFSLCLILAFIVSLGLSIYFSPIKATSSFYLLPTRAWELLAGGIVFLFGNKQFKYAKLIEVLGFILIVLSIILFSTSIIWPGYNALLPVLGTSLVLLANQQNSFFTQPRIFQWFGNTSYSIYLWHWPIVFTLYYIEKIDSLFYICFGIILSFLLGWLSYKYVETPTRRYFSKISLIKAYIIFIVIVIVAVVSVISLYIWKKDGFVYRFQHNIVKVLNVKNDINPRTNECVVGSDGPLKSCQYGIGEISLLVIGDSHVNAMIKGIYQFLPKDTSVVVWSISGCITVENMHRVGFNCNKYISEAIYNIVKNYEHSIPVLVINRINAGFGGEPENEDITKSPSRFFLKKHKYYDKSYIDEMTNAYVETLGKLAKYHQVYVTRPTPEAPYSVPDKVAKEMWIKKQDKVDLSIPLSEYQKRSYYAWQAQDIAQQKYGIHIIDVSKVFCDTQKCHFTKDGMPLFVDDDHMSQNGSLLLTPLFKQAIFGSNQQ